jgi:cardiolipin synthase
LSTVGSANFDYRSFELDFEVNAFIYNARFASIMKETFLKDLENCVLIDPEVWAKRPRMVRWIESVCRLFGPLM